MDGLTDGWMDGWIGIKLMRKEDGLSYMFVGGGVAGIGVRVDK